MKIIIYLFGLSSLIVVFFSGCASVSGFEEGRALGENGNEIIASANFINLPEVLNVNTDDFLVTGFPNIDISYKRGITDKLDLGARLTSNLNAGLFFKYQLLGDDMSQFALGTGMEFGTTLGLLYNIQFPINMSFYTSEKVAFNISPRYIYQIPAGSLNTPLNYLGGNFGVLFGKKNKFGIDIGYFRLGIDATLITVGVGGKFKFK